MIDDPTPGTYLAGFASRLATVRVVYGTMTGRPRLTRAAFAADIGVNPDAYRRYERAEIEPGLEVLASIRRVTGASLCRLIANVENGREDLFERPRTTFGQRLRWARETQEPSLEEAAGVMGVPAQLWDKYEENQKKPSIEKMEEFAHRFSVSLDYLYRGQLVGIHDDVLAVLLKRHPELATDSIGTDTAYGSSDEKSEPPLPNNRSSKRRPV